MLYLTAPVLKSSEGPVTMALVAGSVVVVGLVVRLVFTRAAGDRIRAQARQAEQRKDPSALPEQ